MGNDTKSGAPPSGIFSRSKELLSLATKLGQKEFGSRVNKLVSETPQLKNLQIQMDQAQELVKSLSHLRGAAMKAGQMLSMEARDYLPPEVIEILAKLQDSSETMGKDEVLGVLNEELGSSIVSSFDNFIPTPFASASIGQVHKVRYNDQSAALKVQYPGVASSLRSDIYMLKKLSGTFIKVTGKDIKIDTLFDELATILEQEVDYIQEAMNMQKYREILSDDPRFVVPQPIEDLTNARVLGMTFEPGMKVDDWINTNPTQEQRNEVGRAFLDLYVIEFFENGFVQTDPNFGNFLIRKNVDFEDKGIPEIQIVVLDFGAMKSFSKEFIVDYKKLLKAIRDDKEEELFQRFVDMEMMDPRESKECQEAFAAMLRASLIPFEDERQPFDFSSSEYSKEVRDLSTAFTKNIKYSAPPHQILFLHRKLSGLFRLLQSMKVKIPLQSYWENFVQV